MNQFRVDYVTTLPKEGNAPRVSVYGDVPMTYNVYFYEYNKGLVSQGQCQTNSTVIANAKQWFTDWLIIITDSDDNVVHQEFFNVEDKYVFIKIDGHGLGDNIAWMPYVEEFRLKHNCKVICSTFWNQLFSNVYPDILFVAPNTKIDNVYAQYYVGASTDGNVHYSPFKSDEIPLQMVASSILGLEHYEVQPNLSLNLRETKREVTKFVTISEYGSMDGKKWKAENGWQQVVDFLISCGYAVVAISKEPTQLNNVVDMTGDIQIESRMVDLAHADFHIGVSSGLSWLAWAMGTHVVLISDVTPDWHEFQSNVTRIGGKDLRRVDYQETSITSPQEVIEKLGELIAARYL